MDAMAKTLCVRALGLCVVIGLMAACGGDQHAGRTREAPDGAGPADPALESAGDAVFPEAPSIPAREEWPSDAERVALQPAGG